MRGFIPAGVRSAPKTAFSVCQAYFGAAARPSGDKSPRHRDLHKGPVTRGRVHLNEVTAQ
ncbi:hypothetical protein EGM97_23725 [Pseudomonas sp. AF32]|nr:hypothetical protein [Pseudomonas sp. AF32]